MRIDNLFLAEIRRRLPEDVDVIARPRPVPSGRRVPPRAARDEADAADSLAVDTLIERWWALFPDEPTPTELQLRWVPTQRSDSVGAEAATRQPDVTGAATASIDRIEALLDEEDWSWTRRDPPGDGNIRIIGRRRHVGIDLGIRTDDNVVLLRTRTGPVTLGTLAATLVDTPAEVRPWPR